MTPAAGPPVKASIDKDWSCICTFCQKQATIFRQCGGGEDLRARVAEISVGAA